MKKAIITTLLVLIALAGQAQKTIVWEKPSAFMGRSNGEFVITKVELKQTETVLHICANYRPGSWIRFAKESFLQTPDGTKYGITGGAKTNEQESDLQLDSLFWMPASGKADLALHFKPVPLDTKEMDFLEGYNDGDFKFWNINDGKTKQKTVLPDDWKNVQYAKDETLPAAKINKGIATIKVKMLGYKKGMGLQFYVGGFTPLGSKERFQKFFPFADDGTVKVEVPLWLTREVTVGVQGMAFPQIIIGPGQETNILMKVTSDNKPFVAFKGYMAKTNMDLINAYDTFKYFRDGDNTYLKVKECNTKEERLQCLQDIFDQRVAAINKFKCTKAAKDLMCMTAEEDFVKWSRQFEFQFSQYKLDDDGTVIMTQENIYEKMQKNKDLLALTDEERNYTYKYLDEPASPCCLAFWQSGASYDPNEREKNAYNADLRALSFIMSTDHEILIKSTLNGMESEDCKNVYHEYQAEQQRIAKELASQESVFIKKFDDVAPENILQTILDRYKGKVVLIDIWATWCGPCKAGHQMMAPWKQELKGKNIQFIYITSSTSPLATWQEMIKNIDGDHYYLTKEQYNYVLQHYESEGIPTYAIYDAQGQQTFKTIGFAGLDPIKDAVEKVLK
ncbi:MAG: redoxin family protein [Prevotella sp.]|nr:redoxin family protein [Prevotella sp.]